MYIGIDPGVTDTGVVLKANNFEANSIPLAYGVFNSKGAKYAKHFNITSRVDCLAREISEWVAAEVGARVPDGVNTLSIESPIYNANARGFQIQWRLYQQIVSNLSDMGCADILVELNPGTIKKNHTGDGKASKIDMICAGFFNEGDHGNQEEQEALADAEAICDCGKNPLIGERTDMLVHKEAAHVGPTYSEGLTGLNA